MFSLRVGVVGPREKACQVLPVFEKTFRKVVYAPFDEVKMEVGRGCKAFYKTQNLAELDYVLLLPDGPRKELYYTLARLLEKQVRVSVRSEALLYFWNQPLLLRNLSRAGLPIRRTVAVAQDVATNVIEENLKFPVLVNTASNKKVLVNNPETLKGVLSLFGPGHMMVLQKPVKAEATEVVFVAGNEVMAYRNEGGKRKAGNVNEKVRKMALQVKEVLKTDFCSVIFINTGKGYLVSDLALYPNFKLIQQVTGNDPAVKMATAIGECIEEKDLSVEDLLGKLSKGFVSVARWLSHEIGNFRSP
ncbi:MAG TPA: hypothetical protein ENN60_03025 [archaeon]|nr:hypothetical protein [archaeon]